MKSRWPGWNIRRRQEDVAFDKVIADVPAHHSGVKEAAFFVGCTSKTIDVYPIRSEKELPQRFEDNLP